MYKVWVIARREYWALVSTKSFWIGLVLPPALAALTLLLAALGSATEQVATRRVVLVDPDGLATGFEGAAQELGFEVQREPDLAASDARRSRWAARLQSGDLSAIVEVPPRAHREAPIKLYVDNVAGSTARWLGDAIGAAARHERLKRAGLSAEQAREVMQPIAVETQRLVGPGAKATAVTSDASVIVPFLTLLLIMMGVMSGAVPLLQAVVEEKQQRISEVLLGALPAADLMFGKLLGTTAAGTTVLGVNVAVGALVAARLDLLHHLPLPLLLVAMATSIVAMLMYGSVFLALGAASSELKDAQGLLMPVMLLFLAPLAALPLLTEAPNSAWSVALSLFPFTAPLAMPVRMGIVQSVPAWQVATCFLLSGAATALTLFAAGRVFRIGMLAQGKLPSLGELTRWVLKG
ncbi:MAG TPA: ABC transporter permease [Polyangiaceae bacterium]